MIRNYAAHCDANFTIVVKTVESLPDVGEASKLIISISVNCKRKKAWGFFMHLLSSKFIFEIKCFSYFLKKKHLNTCALRHGSTVLWHLCRKLNIFSRSSNKGISFSITLLNNFLKLQRIFSNDCIKSYSTQ